MRRAKGLPGQRDRCGLPSFTIGKLADQDGVFLRPCGVLQLRSADVEFPQVPERKHRDPECTLRSALENNCQAVPGTCLAENANG